MTDRFDWRIAVVIPCFQVKKHILNVIGAIGPEVTKIYVVDDKCPEESGKFVVDNCQDPRITVSFNAVNLGVGGAVMAGYQAALKDGMHIVIKIDGDEQMDPALIPRFVQPIKDGRADYTKGNRFFNLDNVRSMPALRLFGNAVLSFLNKLSSGYWDIFDPTNGYTAIHTEVLRELPFDKVSQRYFFESDMLFRLNLLKAVVVDVPMDAKYGDEVSNLKVSKIVTEFLGKHARNFYKRIFYNYYLRDLSLASIELPLGLLLFIFGTSFGLLQWWHAAANELATPAGTVMLSALPTLMGLQLILAFLAYDIGSVPRTPRHFK
ncbi:MAG: glycosyltransferase family 2 protein [Candidatus Methylopumilus sp.]|nr:glycosyltransferase family 2 protein [Candidatus Methylopumilus sp.]